ncbi:MAG: hypothetical protein K2N12_06420 [Helicobacter sp.]|nr:hypothetical protein [Helicobacter sp.]
MKRFITLTVASLALAGMAFAADAEKQDLLASVSNGALCEKDAKALSADEAKQVVGGWWSKENRPAYKPLFLYFGR